MNPKNYLIKLLPARVAVLATSLWACGSSSTPATDATIPYDSGSLDSLVPAIDSGRTDSLPATDSALIADTTDAAHDTAIDVAAETIDASNGTEASVDTGAPDASVAPGCNGVPALTVGAVTWTPNWCQEFNGAASTPDTSVWHFDLGNNNGWGNNEAEIYCGPPGYAGNPAQCPTTFSPSTSPGYIDGNGHLVIQPINNNGSWLSTRVTTEGTQNFQYGLIEASIELPDTTNQGLWPAFWSLGSDIATGTAWPNCGEADIMEDWSPQVDNGAGPLGNNSTLHTTKTGGAGVGSRYTFPSGQQANTAFHTYGMIWSQNQIQFFIDNPSAPFWTATPSTLPAGDTWPFNANIFLLLNVAVGGTLGGSTTALTNPKPMLVDYVRWYVQ